MNANPLAVLRRQARGAACFAGLALASSVSVLVLMPAIAIAQENVAIPETATIVVAEPEKTWYIPGLEWMENIKTFGGLRYFHVPEGTYVEGGPTPDEVAAAIDQTHRNSDGPATSRVTKVYSIFEVETGMYAVRYRTDRNYGIVRNAVFDEIVAYFPDAGVDAGGITFVDPIYLAQVPDIDPTWRAVAGGIGALAALAAALGAAVFTGTGAAGTTQSSDRAAQNPNRIVGHILKLNTKRVEVTRSRPAALRIEVLQICADGTLEHAPHCEITLTMPKGYIAGFEHAITSLISTITQEPQARTPSTIHIAVGGPTCATTDLVQVVGEKPDTIVWRFEPAMTPLVADGKTTVALVADVQLSPTAQADPATDIDAVRESIRFAPESEWVEISDPVDWTAGGRAVNLIARCPLHDPWLPPPASVDIAISANVGGVALTETATISCTGTSESEDI